MRRKWLLATLAAWIFVVASGAHAASASLLSSPQVRRELKISHRISVQVLALLNEAARLNQGGVTIAKRAAQLKAQRERTDPATLQRRAVALLTEAQRRRLEELNLQQSGPFILNGKSAATEIGASRQQIKVVQQAQHEAFTNYLKRIRPLDDAYFQALHAKQKNRSDAIQRSRKKLSDAYMRKCRAAFFRVLTPPQEKRYRALLGAPFDFRNLRYDTRAYPMD